MKLTVENGCFSYVKGQPILQNMNFSAQSGELLAILGPNGAGKTTLLRCMMGFLSWDSGKSTLDGKDMSRMTPKELWQHIAYVPQAKGTSSALLVSDMIMLGCTNRLGVFSTPGEKEKEQVKEIAEQLGITYLLNKKCNAISGGELQMVLIARALAASPEILILDEPESNLDFKNQLIVLDAMSRLAAEGMCCIFNTHYPTHALMRATKSLIVPKSGEAFFGNTAQIVTEENIERTFGVETIIGEVETSGNQYKSILPLRIARKTDKPQTAFPTTRAIAVITILFSDYGTGETINGLLHQYNHYIVGRMGMPYREGNTYIINITLDAPRQEIDTLFHRLSILPGVRAKVTFAD
ncbi:MAG: ATP-binding cassette domain-containing protein [Lachnospiraceae bacterium]|nr:ATP-binding cassette domain-containing protein [Lachnospiraceae bacterium]